MALFKVAKYSLLGMAFSFASASFAQSVAAEASGISAVDSRRLEELPSPADRVWIASRIYHAVSRYFAHWEALPPAYNWDEQYKSYLKETLSAPDRRSFSLATVRLVASLSNGHTSFSDKWLEGQQRWPFHARPIQGRWTVTVSRTSLLDPGDVIERIDGVPVDQWLLPTRALVGQSDARSRDRVLFLYTWLMPQQVTLELASGRRIKIDRAAPRSSRRPAALPAVVSSVRADGTVVISIPSFGESRFEAEAIAAVKAHAGAPLILFDVRGNGGGNTPSKLLATIMDRPYAGTIVATPMTVAEFDAHASYDPALNPAPKAMLRYGPEVNLPHPDHVKGRMALLVDGGCGSACEDFAIRFKSGSRGLVAGESTAGSTGQPIFVNWPEWGMSLRVSTKREYLPDGSQFEGAGIKPDIHVDVLPQDLKSEADPQLDRAIAAIQKALARDQIRDAKSPSP